MTPLLAHQGGWDELLLSAGLVLAMLGVSRMRGRRGAEGSPAPQPPPRSACAYCGAALAEDEIRCPSCGFRHRSPETRRGDR